MVLVWAIVRILKLLHPFMPFITEEIWQALKGGTPLMLEKFPAYEDELCYSAEEADFEKIITAIKGIRNRRAEMNVPPSKKAELFIETAQPEVYEKGIMFFERLGYASSVKISDKVELPDAVTIVTDSARLFIPLSEIIDRDKELARLNKEKASVLKDIEIISKKLGNEGFMAKAPANVIESEKDKMEKAQRKLEKIEQSIAAMK